MLDAKQGHRTPAYTATVGMWLFLAALTMLFGATMVGYLIIRARAGGTARLGTLHFPPLLWLSTVVILVGSLTIHAAVTAVRRERQRDLRRWLGVTCALAALFCIVQVPALAALWKQHQGLRGQGLYLYGLIVILIIVHALHVLGGIVALALVTRNGFAGRYDHEHYYGVKHAAMYWHFLDVVWLVMFLGMFFAG
ncbi:MAG TPA: cytochrome c oxidase subunit 3 [Tepidisphaeraceae bacterium]|nr:cytochrome c oxidase subunit 3 [Tepidisphaeraceae bacterium]